MQWVKLTQYHLSQQYQIKQVTATINLQLYASLRQETKVMTFVLRASV
ncbi:MULTISPECIES: hypothetical protein [unclassified Microcoleus]